MPPRHTSASPTCPQVDEVVDTIAASLAKYGGALHPGPRGAAAFGEAPKARMALEALFAIANR